MSKHLFIGSAALPQNTLPPVGAYFLFGSFSYLSHVDIKKCTIYLQYMAVNSHFSWSELYLPPPRKML